ncbi:MAG: hypothetical protein IKS17_08230 [Firmicutes bacterium]|nr:hypothetical protein [Bacillota bacterium]
MFKKITAIILALSAILCSIPVYAADGAKYIALGDSIASGYALSHPETQSYPALFSNAHQMKYENLAVPGKTSQELLDELKNDTYDLSGASVITVSIGSNDIMKPMINAIAKELGVDPEKEDDINKAILDRIEFIKKYEKLETLKGRVKRIEALFIDNADFYAICDNTSQVMIPQIAAEIRKKNPSAQIIFTNYYNPFKNKILVVPLSDSSQGEYAVGNRIQPYIDRLNKGLAASDDYKFADVYAAFTSSRYVNANIDMREPNVSFDPHPTALGHRAIYLAVNDVYTPEPQFRYGDANGDGMLDASDAAETLQKVLKENYVLGLEKKTADWKKYLDVDASGSLEASDAADIMQKVLKENYIFRAEK